jgi:hypothetical protein
VVEHLPYKHRAQIQNTHTQRKKKTQEFNIFLSFRFSYLYLLFRTNELEMTCYSRQADAYTCSWRKLNSSLLGTNLFLLSWGLWGLVPHSRLKVIWLKKFYDHPNSILKPLQ